MTIKHRTLALANGVAATTTNLDINGGTGIGQVVSGTGGAITGDFDCGPYGQGLRFVSGSGGVGTNCQIRIPSEAATMDQTWRLYYLMPAGSTSADCGIIQGRSASAMTWRISRLASGAGLKVEGAGFSGSNTFMASGLSNYTWYRFEIRVKIGTTTSNSTLIISVYPVFGTPAQINTAVATFTSTTYNCGTVAMSGIDVGILTVLSGSNTVGAGLVSVDDAQSTTFLGDWVDTPTSGANIKPKRTYGVVGALIHNNPLSTIAKTVSDGSDSSSVVFPTADDSAKYFRLTLPALTSPPTSFQPTIRSRRPTGTGACEVRLLDTDGTLRKTWSISPGTDFGNIVLSALSSGEISSVADWSGVVLECRQT